MNKINKIHSYEKILFYCDTDQTDICIICSQSCHKGHRISSLKDKIISDEIETSLSKWNNFFDAKKDDYNIKGSNLKKLIADLKQNRGFLLNNIESEYDKFLELIDKNKFNFLNNINEVYENERNLISQMKNKIDNQAKKLKSYIAEMECLAHDINSLSNKEILEIDLKELSELNRDTSNVILDSIKNKNSNFCFKDFNPIEDCFLKKNEIILSEFLDKQKEINDENERKKLLSDKINSERKNTNETFNTQINAVKGFEKSISKDTQNSNSLLNKIEINKINEFNNHANNNEIKCNLANGGSKEKSNGLNKKNIFEENLNSKSKNDLYQTGFSKNASDEIILTENSLLNDFINKVHEGNNQFNLSDELKLANQISNLYILNHNANSENINSADNKIINKGLVSNNLIDLERNISSNSHHFNQTTNNDQNDNNITNISIHDLNHNKISNHSDLNNLAFGNSFRFEEMNNNNSSMMISNSNLSMLNNNLIPNSNNDNNNVVSNNFLNNSFYRKNSFTNNEIITTSSINFIPYLINNNTNNNNSNNNTKKKSDYQSEQKLRKTSDKQYINNLNNNINSCFKYKVLKFEENREKIFQNYLTKTDFYQFDNISDLILLIGDSKDKTILLFNKKNYTWKKLENSILGEYEFLDYCCLTKYKDDSYLITGGCIYSNYRNTAVNTTYLTKILNHKENFLISFIPFAQMNKPRFSHGACNLRGKPYVYGGHDGTSTLSCIEFFDIEFNIFKYAYESDDRNTLSEMNVEREIFASCVIDDKYIYVFGGFNDIHLDTIERFDVDTGKWDMLELKLNIPLQNSTACVLKKGEIALIGGYNGTLQRVVEVLNYEKNVWVQGKISNEKDKEPYKLIIPRRRAHCYKNENKVSLKIFFIKV